MLVKRFTYKHFWISLLVLIQLLATVLPANTVLAAGVPEACETPGVQAASTLAVEVTSDDQEVVIPKEKVDLSVFGANWRRKLTDAQRVEYLVIDTFLMHTDKLDFIPGDEYLMETYEKIYVGALDNLADIVGETGNYDLIVHTMLNIALDMPSMARAVPFVWRELTLEGTRAKDQQFEQMIGQSAVRYNLSDHLLERSPEILARVFECAHDIPAVAEAYNKIHGGTLNANIGDSAATILAKNPDLDLPPEILDAIGEDGSVTISLNDLKNLSEKEFGKIRDTIDEMKETLSEIDEQQHVIIDYIKDQELKAKYQELVKKRAAEAQLKLDAAKASVSILSTLATQIDPKLGKQINVIGTASIQIGQAINTWMKAVSGLKGLDKLMSLNTVVMSGSILTAVMSVVALFAPQEPTPEQIILQEIGKLRQQVDQLRTEMHSRFDRIDRGLNAIYTTMSQRFFQIDVQLGKLNGNILDVQQSLYSLDTKLSRIERNNYEFLNVLGRRPYIDAANAGLGYLERTGRPLPYEPNFVDLEILLHGWGTIHAFDALNNGPTKRNYSDGQVLEELNAYPIDSNINYLNGWLIAHNVPPFADEMLASPRDWLFASRAYTQLGLEWPEYMQQVNAGQQASLDQVGLDLEEAMQNISTVQTPDGPQGNRLLYSTVITYYENKMEQLDSAIQSVETTFVNEKRALDWLRVEEVNLFGGLDQQLTYLPPEFTTVTCNDANVPAPSNLRGVIPHFDRYNLAEYLRLGKLNVCVHYEMAGEDEVCYTEPDPPYAEVCDLYVGAKAVVDVTFDNVSIGTLSALADGGYKVPDWYFHFGQLMPHWTESTNFKGRIEALTTIDEPTPEVAAQRAELFNTVTNKLEMTLESYQKKMYQRVLHDMTAGAIQAQTIEAAGSKALLDSYVVLGLPRALVADEFLYSMLYGDQQLMDDNEIMQSYSMSLTNPITGTNLLVNPRLTMKSVTEQRSAAFTEMVYQYLDAITAGTHVEGPDYLANTRRMLDLTTRIAHLAIAAPEEEAIEGLQASSNSPTVLGNATNFAATVTAGTNIVYSWDFGDGSTGTGDSPNHSYAQAGAYVARVTATNSMGESMAEVAVQVHAPNADETPIAGLTALQNGPTALGEATSFAATVAAGTNVSYVWDFGDGKAGIGANITHTYAEAGVYEVSVIASNSVSVASAEVQVVVEPGGVGQTTDRIYLPSLSR